MNDPAPVFKQLDHLAARAESSLREAGMLGASAEGHVRLDPARLEGLDVRLAA